MTSRARSLAWSLVSSLPMWVLAVAMEICSWSDDAERDLRPAKTQQKISGRLRSDQATAAGTPSPPAAEPAPTPSCSARKYHASADLNAYRRRGADLAFLLLIRLPQCVC